MNYGDELPVRNLKYANRHDVRTPQDRTPPPHESNVKKSNTEVEPCGRQDESDNCTDERKHVRFAGGMSAQCQNLEHNHLQKLKSPPPQLCDEAEGCSNMHKILRKDPIADIEAKTRQVLHLKVLHPDRQRPQHKSEDV